MSLMLGVLVDALMVDIVYFIRVGLYNDIWVDWPKIDELATTGLK